MKKPAEGYWIAGFDQQRELANGTKYVHGALDICPLDRERFKEIDRDLFAIERGELSAHLIYMQTDDRNSWNAWGLPWPGNSRPDPYPFANYTAETYGICLVLRTSSRMYLYAHLNEVPEFLPLLAKDQEMVFKKDREDRWLHAQFWGPMGVEEGERIGRMGWFGKTIPAGRTGCHLHIEGHEGFQWKQNADRVRLDQELRGII
jgi:hypothetical protein